ncbi:tyrosine-type recombinase/integrase [Listeria fleischmannii]
MYLFRHIHTCLLFESNANLKNIQDRLGHKDLKTTMNIYVHIAPKKNW